MKRIYIAILFILFSIAVGTVEFITINTNVDKYIAEINRTAKLVDYNKTKDAEKLSKKTAENFESYSKNVLYCYYRHDHLEEITDDLYGLEDLLDDKRTEDYHEKSHLIIKKLLSLKEKEHITFQNIL